MESRHVMKPEDKIYVGGHNGLVGSAIVRKLEKEGFHNLILRSHSELDLTNQEAVNRFFEAEKPDYVFMAAAMVGGIQANREALDRFLYINTMIEFNTIKAAYENGVKKYCLMGSGCIYPRDCPQPIREEYLLTSPLEKTNEGYALAKISGLKYGEFLNTHHPDRMDFISVMPCNLYGPGDNYHPEHSHVIPALLRRFHEAKKAGAEKVTMWGTGSAMREFLHIDDVADACFFLMQHYSGDPGEQENVQGISWVNVGCGEDLTMKELGSLVAETVGYQGAIEFDHIHPDGTPRKLLDSSKLFAMGWRPSFTLREGLEDTYEDYKKNMNNYRS